MVEAGETGGILDLILQRLSTFIEKLVKLQAGCGFSDDLSRGRHRHGCPRSGRDHGGRNSPVCQHLPGPARTRRTVTATNANRGWDK